MKANIGIWPCNDEYHVWHNLPRIGDCHEAPNAAYFCLTADSNASSIWRIKWNHAHWLAAQRRVEVLLGRSKKTIKIKVKPPQRPVIRLSVSSRKFHDHRIKQKGNIDNPIA